MNDRYEINILLADDDKDDCLIFKEALEELTLQTRLTTVHDGEQLMLHLTANSDLLPQILFLDLNMPRKNGFSCLEEIKRSEKLKLIPVIIYSTSYDRSMADLLYKKGAHYYICKPVDFYELKNVIEHAITLFTENTGEHSRIAQPPKENFLLSRLKSALL